MTQYESTHESFYTFVIFTTVSLTRHFEKELHDFLKFLSAQRRMTVLAERFFLQATVARCRQQLLGSI